MKRISGEYPYDDYWLYVVHHNKENRKMANLILKIDNNIRTTTSYARYLMSVHLKRFLTKDEQVDHIDNNKINDAISNLQILSQEENKIKQEIYNSIMNPKFIKLNCSNCDILFDYPARNHRFYSKQGQKRFHCSKECGYKSLKKRC